MREKRVGNKQTADSRLLRGTVFLSLPLAVSLVGLVSCGSVEQGLEGAIKAEAKVAGSLDDVDQRLAKEIKQRDESNKQQFESLNNLINTLKERDGRNKRVLERQYKGAKILEELAADYERLSPERREELAQLAKQALDPTSLDEPVNLYASLKEKEGVLLADLRAAQRELKLLKISYSDLEYVKQVLVEVKTTTDRINAIEEQLQDLERREEIAKDDLEAAGRENWRVAKEIALYLFGFKWLWGIFTGFKATTDTTEQVERLEKVREEGASLRVDLEKERETLTIKQEAGLRTLGLGFDLAARREPDLLRSMQLTALKERLLVAFREQAERRAEFRAQERVYVEAIRVGLMEPLEPPVKQRWRVAGVNLASSFNGGYNNEVRFNQPFTFRGFLEPRTEWALDTYYRVGGGWRDELRAFRRYQYEAALEKASLANLHLEKMVATVTSTKLDEVVAQAAEASSTEATKGGQPKDTLSFAFFAEVATKMLEAQRKIDALNRDLASLRDQLAKLEFSNPGVTKQVEEARVANVERIFFAKQQRYHNLVSEAKELIKEGRDSDKLLAALEQLRYAVLDLKEKNDRLLASKAEWARLVDLSKIRELGLATAQLYNYRVAKEITLYLFGFKWFWGLLTGFRVSSDTSKNKQLLYEIEQQIKEGKEPFKQQLAALERDRDLAKEAVKKAVESAVESARDPFAKLSLSDYKQQLDSAFVAFDFATDRFRSQEQVYLSALEGGTKYFSPEANSEYARVDRFQRSPGGEVRLKPSLAADWMLLKREQISETYYKARQDLQAEREVFDSYFASRLEHLFLTIVSQVEVKRAQFRRKLVDIERIRSEVNSLASESGRELKLELDSKGRPTFFFSEEELSWGAFGEQHVDLGLTFKEQQRQLDRPLPSLPLLAQRIAQAKDVFEVANIERELVTSEIEQQAEEKRESEERFEELVSVDTESTTVDSALKRELLELGKALDPTRVIDYQVTKDPKLEPFKVEGILPVEEKEGREEALLAAIQDDFILNNKLDLVSLGGKIEQLVRSISGEELANKPLGSEDPEEAAREERLLREVDWLVKRLTSYYLITRPDADRNEVREGILRELYDLSRRVHPEKLVDRPQKTPTLSLPPLSVEPPVYTPKKVEEEVESETEKQEQEQQEQQGEQEQSKEPEATKQEPSSVEVATEEGSEQTEVEQVEVETEVATSETETETVEVATEVEPTETDGQTSTITEEVVEVEVEQQEQEQVEGTEASTSEGAES